jgi:starch phosphorylase
MAGLALQFSSNRMMREYVEQHYVPAALAFRRRSVQDAKLARELQSWTEMLERHWSEVRFGDVKVSWEGDRWRVEVQVHLGSVPPEMVLVELYADPVNDAESVRQALGRTNEMPGSMNAYLYRSSAPASSRPSWHFTPRIVPHHPEARIPIEAPIIVWSR